MLHEQGIGWLLIVDHQAFLHSVQGLDVNDRKNIVINLCLQLGTINIGQKCSNSLYYFKPLTFLVISTPNLEVIVVSGTKLHFCRDDNINKTEKQSNPWGITYFTFHPLTSFLPSKKWLYETSYCASSWFHMVLIRGRIMKCQYVITVRAEYIEKLTPLWSVTFASDNEEVCTRWLYPLCFVSSKLSWAQK